MARRRDLHVRARPLKISKAEGASLHVNSPKREPRPSRCHARRRGLGNPLGVGQTLLMRAPLGQHMDAPAVPHGTSRTNSP
jgi:hypothetical protein